MSYYNNRVYPWLINTLGNPGPIREIRKRIIPSAKGIVLEIGVGTGANLIHYNPSRITKLYALEPNPGMIRFAEGQLRRTHFDIEFLDLPGERIPLNDETVDTVVSTFTLCTIPGIADAIQGIRRVLKPDGRLVFFELGLSPDPQVQRWQRWWEPVSQQIFGGLYLTRDIPTLLNSLADFQIEQMESSYLANFPKSWTYTWWGNAILQSHSHG